MAGTRSTRTTPLSPATKKARKGVVHGYATQLNNIYDTNPNKLQPHGALRDMVAGAKRMHPWISKSQICCTSVRLRKKLKSNLTILADVTIATNNTTANDDTTVSPPHITTCRNGGRPIGSTNKKKESLEEKKMHAKDEIAIRLKTAKKTLSTQKYLAKGSYNRIHEDVAEEFNLLDTNFEVSIRTVASRLRRGTPKGKTKTGPDSPASSIEPVMLQFAKWKQEANQSLKPSEGLVFPSSLRQNKTKIMRIR
eukprot:CAMPEP_0194247058 /NCGR_PEP_ID=MMETSP0158-20130606/15950_1 /TAXON_ID=33649 /ORGANISM="Thalassionema nitzschioides, Strain L26-B" /LENGTH=251 /DNA_ID=CAMNT_0038983089 /DNA_START=426 /DNA_END=1178 /DNA_ORIENTATION=+